jgi:outer membrane protein TolC
MKYKYRAAQMQFLPTLNAFGSYELHDTSIFGTGAESYMVGAQLKWNLFKGGQQLGVLKKQRLISTKRLSRLFSIKMRVSYFLIRPKVS